MPVSNLDDFRTDVQRRLKGVPGLLAVLVASCVISLCLSGTPTAVGSFCGTCRWVARSEILETGALLIAGNLALWLFAWETVPSDVKVARCAAVTALAAWALSVGFVLGWW